MRFFFLLVIAMALTIAWQSMVSATTLSDTIRSEKAVGELEPLPDEKRDDSTEEPECE